MPDDERTDGPEDSPSSTRRRGALFSAELKTVLVMTTAFSLELTTYTAVETLQSSLNSEGGLGMYALACLYGPFFLFSMPAPSIVRALTPKWTFFVAWSADVFYLAAMFYPTWLTLIPASFLAGAVTGPACTAKDLYVSQMARQSVEKETLKVQDKAKSEPRFQSKLSFFNGITFGGFSAALVLGQVISSAVFTQSSSVHVTGGNCGPLNCPDGDLVALNRSNHTASFVRPEQSLIYTFLGIQMSLIVLAILLTVFCLQQIPSGNQDKSFRSTFLSCALKLKDARILLLIPQIIFCAFLQGVIQSDYTRAYIACGAGVGMVGYVMMSRGIAATVASVCCGHLMKYTGRQSQVVLSLAGYVGVLITYWFWTPAQTDSILMYFVLPVLFGVSEAIFQTHISTVIALMFENDISAAVSNYYTFKALTKAFSFGLSGFLCVWVKLIISTVMFVTSAVSFVVLEVLLRFCKSRPEKESAAEKMLTYVVQAPNETKESEI